MPSSCKPEDKGLLTHISHSIENGISKGYKKLTTVIVNHPWVFIIIPLVISMGLAIRLAFPFETELDPEDLYTPQDSVAFQQRIFVEDTFGFEPSLGIVFLKGQSLLSASNTNAQNQQALLSFLTAYEIMRNVSVTVDGEVVTYDIRCNTTGEGCVQASVLDFFDYSEANITGDGDVLGTINAGLAVAAMNGVGELGKHQLFGGVVPDDDSTTVMSAEVFAHRFYFVNKEMRENGNLVIDDPRYEWEIEAGNRLFDLELPVGTTHPYFNYLISDASDGSVTSDIGLLPAGYTLLIIYSVFMLSSRSPVYSYGSMILMSFLSIGFAIVCMWSLGLIFGLPFTLVVQASFFLLVGLGIDDTFVILAAHRHVDINYDPKTRVIRAMITAGVSITLTSITDMVAFASGTITSLPAIRLFCIYTLLGVFFDFVFQVTFVVASLYFTTVREQQNRYDALPCVKAKDGRKQICTDKPYDPEAKDFMDEFFGDILPSIILHPIGKISVLVVAFALVGSSAYYATLVPTRFRLTAFIPSSSPLTQSVTILDQFFGGTPAVTSLFTGPGVGADGLSGQDVQLSMLDLAAAVDADPEFSYCVNWYLALNEFVASTSPGDITSNGTIATAQFYPQLNLFLQSPASHPYTGYLAFNDTTGTLKSSQIFCVLTESSGSNAAIEHVDAARSLIAQFPLLGGTTVETVRGTVTFPFSYAFMDLFTDGLIVIKEETLRNILVAFVAVAVVALVLLANVRAVFIVLLMLAMVDANVLGFMYYVGVDFNSVSAVNLVISVGLAIDSSVHIAHAFLTSHGTRTERAKKALKKLGSSVFHGNFSTFLVMVPLATANSFIFQVFFKLLSLILLFAMFQGLLVLPVVLSLIGPDPYPEKAHLTLEDTVSGEEKIDMSAVDKKKSATDFITSQPGIEMEIVTL